jgi:hypothetical protein
LLRNHGSSDENGSHQQRDHCLYYIRAALLVFHDAQGQMLPIALMDRLYH